MIIDLAYLLVIIVAAIKGFRQGLIIGVFSLLGFIIGLAAALKLSAVVAEYLGESTGIGQKWLPVVSFLLVFIVVVVIIQLGARMLDSTAQTLMLGPANKFGGMLLNVIIQTIIFSVVLFFVVQMKWIGEDTIAGSQVYPWVEPVGPWVINGIGKVVPVFKDLFVDLQEFFEGVAEKIPDKHHS